jgi:di/tricarboxylate transporter
MLYLKLLPIIFFPVLFWIIPHPEGVSAPTWHMVGIYLAMLCGLVLRPFTDAVIMLIILGFASLVLDPAPCLPVLAALWSGLLSAPLLFAKRLLLPDWVNVSPICC